MSVTMMGQKQSLSPKDFAQWQRSFGDVYWWEKGNYWVVTDYALACALLKSNKVTCNRAPFFISRMPNIDLSLLKDFFSVVQNMMVMQDDMLHHHHRMACLKGFGRQVINQLVEKLAAKIKRRFNETEWHEPVDFMERFASYVPAETLCAFFQIPDSEKQQFIAHAKLMTGFFGGATTYDNQTAVAVNQAARELSLFFADLFAYRQKDPSDDFVSFLLAQQSLTGCSEEGLIAQAILMWVAGMVTTSDQLANNVYTLFHDFPNMISSNPLQQENMALLSECNRLDPAVTFTFRLANQKIAIGNHIIRSGQTIFIANHACNRDPTVFHDPNNIHISQSKPHLAYGVGPHFCMGAKLSLLEMSLVLAEWVKRVETTKVLDAERLHYSVSFSGFAKLMLTCKLRN